MINFEISQYLPVDLSQYIIEYKYLEEFEEGGIRKSKVLVVAVQKTIVDGYFALTESLGFNPVSMDVCSNSIAKLLHKPTVLNEEPYSSLDTVAAIDIGHRSLNISIVNDGKLALSRMITQGSYMIDQRIAENFDIELAEAEEIKQEAVNLSQDAEVTPALEMLLESIHLTINDWIRDIDRVIKFYESRSGGKKVKQVLLYGGGSNMKGIGEYFSKELHLPVSTIEMLNHLKWDKKLNGICIKHYMNAIGAISNSR